MHLLITLTLAIALVVALVRLAANRRAVHGLQQALFRRRPFLHDEISSGSSTVGWAGLATAANDLIAEVGRLQQLRTGQLAQLEATLGSLQEAVLIVDEGNRILLANRALHAIFPRATNILGRRLELVLQSVSFLNYVEAVRAAEAAPRHEIEFVEDGRSTWLEATGTVIPTLDGQAGAWTLFVLHDVSRQKKLEAVRKEFVANVSHELRTPLSVIKGYVETLVDDPEGIPAVDRERFLKTIQRHTERLNSLLEDLLVLSRLESLDPGLRLEPTRLDELLGGIIDDYRARPAAVGRTLVFTADAGVGELVIDPLKISQVVENLLDNALKYTPVGAHIALSIGLDRGAGIPGASVFPEKSDAGVGASGGADGGAGVGTAPAEVVVCVRDDGAGIPAVDLPHLFERFYRVDKGRSREKGGTGLGLSIVKHIVQLHGGRVWVESVVGQGTAFYFSLPLQPLVGR